ncbi:hypothetical protein J5N97_013588 [Dioscorea zingiberensis]|uniref:Uncharacterized protein n=1 Tax=Dioscorea zingiberensis TaxID=325984 RepID=A0A9D5CS58_9LILI|nr:hypothetical protein J5N97_013588 [Dioscorea zingiberensis]
MSRPSLLEGESLFLFFMDTTTKVSLEFYSHSLEVNNNDNHGLFQHNQQEQPLSDCISNTITGFSASMELDGAVEVREIGGGNLKELEPQLGMEFDSLESGKLFYYEYAARTWFRARVGEDESEIYEISLQFEVCSLRPSNE